MMATNTSSIQIIPFEERYAQDFGRLNYEWLEKYFDVEPHDREMLDAPYEYIIKNGGQIFFAKYDDKIVGTAALIAENETTFELAKMGVNEAYQGLKIGKQLIIHALEKAREAGKKRVVLESNTKLTTALNLYIKMGFMVAPLSACSPYARCNIRMFLDL
jgi:putative acetyltransferase